MPRNAAINGDGFRTYRFEPDQDEANIAALIRAGVPEQCLHETTEVLSVTSIRSLCGDPYQLVNWKIANVVNLATGTRKIVKIGPRGGVNEVYAADGPFPGEFARLLLETEGQQEKLDALRRWLRETADEPRDVAAARGSVVHKLIELNASLKRLDDATIVGRMEDQWREERRRVKPAVTDDDIAFIRNAMRNYWDMRKAIPFVVVAVEPQVFNLTAGYGGSADVIIWFLGDWDANGNFVAIGDENDVLYWQAEADANRLTIEKIEEYGGSLAVGDWKTSKGVYTGHVTQVTAYMAGEFVGGDGRVNERLTRILKATKYGVLFNIRPNFWEADRFAFSRSTLIAFLGSVMFARFLAMNKEPGGLFASSTRGQAEGIVEIKEIA